jgi:U4/U6.U5 tri-snRNP-associated protein 3
MSSSHKSSRSPSPDRYRPAPPSSSLSTTLSSPPPPPPPSSSSSSFVDSSSIIERKDLYRIDRARSRSRSAERDRERDRHHRDHHSDRDRRDREYDGRSDDRDRDRDREKDRIRRERGSESQNSSSSASRAPHPSLAALPFGERSAQSIEERLKREAADRLKSGQVAAPTVVHLTPDMDEDAMMAALGLPKGFDSTQGKPVPDGNVAGVRVQSKRQYRQYMNRKGGFNRPLAASY